MAAAAAAVGPGAGGAGAAVPGGAGPCATVSVFPGARLLTIGDANGEIQRHAEQQALRLEVRAGPDAAGIALYSRPRSWRVWGPRRGPEPGGHLAGGGVERRHPGTEREKRRHAWWPEGRDLGGGYSGRGIRRKPGEGVSGAGGWGDPLDY
ncbi:Hypothetical predicted protein [Marmota monax]|uniref:Uncharacterized protein n=1 Tax=Marmota monax TaxID=9995 RepID=A0A5E4ABN4_MARMO|nr:Hypothetical predicted protein [Marmota monax]